MITAEGSSGGAQTIDVKNVDPKHKNSKNRVFMKKKR